MKLRTSKSKRCDAGSQVCPSEDGATILEFSIVALLFFALLLTFVDLAHYLSVRAVMIKSAQDALQIAVKTQEFQYELSELDSTSEEYTKFIGVRDAIVDKASLFPLNTFLSPDGSGGIVELLSADGNDVLADGDQTLTGMDAIVLRPGDTVNIPSTGESLSHPHTPEVGEKMENVLKAQPVIVQLRARKRFFVPIFFDSLPINVSAVGWVQQYPKAGFNLEEFLSNAPTEDPEDPEGDSCEVDPGCANFDVDKCKCCDHPGWNACRNGSTWNTSFSVCGCDCSTVSCPYGHEWDCFCKPCEQPDDVVCSCWNATTCSCDPVCAGS